MRARPAAAAAALTATLAACGVGGHIGHGMSAYREGRFRVALSAFIDVEPLRHRMNRKGYLRYLVYRGLSHYRLGQRESARAFLRRGAVFYRSCPPFWLPRFAVAEMRQALAALGGSAATPSRPPPRQPASQPPPPDNTQPAPPR